MKNIIKELIQESKDLKIYFIDVGQGDSTLIVTPHNKTILIDTGGIVPGDEDEIMLSIYDQAKIACEEADKIIFIVDGKDVPQDPHEAFRLHQAIWNCGVRTALANGGVVNDHHGVGIKLGRLMKEQYGPAMQVFEGIKKHLDPNGIMNPFKLGL